jgi:hypothetical protein
VCNPICKFIRDERGTLLITEWVFLTTILVIAVVPFTFNLREHFTRAQIQSGGAGSAVMSANHDGR